MLGTSPPIITEFVDYLESSEFNRVTDLVVIATRDPEVTVGLPLIREAIKCRKPHVNIHIKALPIDDIGNQDDTLLVAETVATTIIEERNIHRCECVYMTISGGRKDMSVMMALVAQIAGVDGIYHLIHKDVVRYNIMLERMRHEIIQLAESENPGAYYEAHAADFNRLMYPEPSDLAAIKLPILPYPRSQLIKLLDILENGGTALEVEQATIDSLSRSGLLTETRGKLVPTDVSIKLSRALHKAV